MSSDISVPVPKFKSEMANLLPLGVCGRRKVESGVFNHFGAHMEDGSVI